ncbi:hypothetical protein GMES_3211 [Paraglaciecola mesophila KMM 241]|uniref:Uncharacterized protein n=1 Tax=Paraglaciecola mesophila KMM 241 TaxID=1128912 RepID=K6XY12_9ALTE|nr:hypothetical protein GMES_3211 [Paraglaciecola mesophila KMM 241]
MLSAQQLIKYCHFSHTVRGVCVCGAEFNLYNRIFLSFSVTVGVLVF